MTEEKEEMLEMYRNLLRHYINTSVIFNRQSGERMVFDMAEGHVKTFKGELTHAEIVEELFVYLSGFNLPTKYRPIGGETP